MTAMAVDWARVEVAAGGGAAGRSDGLTEIALGAIRLTLTGGDCHVERGVVGVVGGRARVGRGRAGMARGMRAGVALEAGMDGRLANTRVLLTCTPPVPPRGWSGRESAAPWLLELVATRDPYDRAHDVRDDQGFLVPAASGRGARARPTVSAQARRYPRSQMVGKPGREVGIDSAADALGELQGHLRGLGLAVHGTGTMAEARAKALLTLGGTMDEIAIRDLVLRRRTRQGDYWTGEPR